MRVGIDEAGKGPVLGPMVAAAVGVPDSEVLPADVADSKRLAAERREELDAAIRADDRIAVGVAEIEVERIDDPETDMNGLAVTGHADATATVLSNGRSPDAREVAVLADACDTSESRFARRLAAAIDDGIADGTAPDRDLEIEARHGADDEDPVVAAASIVAKVERDARMAAIANDVGVEIGSGYPSDPTTRAFLEQYVRERQRLPECARQSWQTCEDVLASVEQAGLGEY